jgi:hypothetical protein
MSEPVDFILRGTLDGAEITPGTINFTRFNEFNAQVERFIVGSTTGGGVEEEQKLLLSSVFVQVLSGSYCLRVDLPPALLLGLRPEISALQEREDSLSAIDESRAKVIEGWQLKARTIPDLTYEIRLPKIEQLQPGLIIAADTDFRHGGESPWVSVETYLLGEVYDMGGEHPNLHIRVGLQKYIVQTDKASLRAKQGLLYEKCLLRVRGEKNLRTGELKRNKLYLVEFVDYLPDYDESALNRFIETGTEAWADVPDAATWVREMRGN